MKGCIHSWLPSLILVCINISHDLIFTNCLSNKYLNPRQGREGMVMNEQWCVHVRVRMCACVCMCVRVSACVCMFARSVCCVSLCVCM